MRSPLPMQSRLATLPCRSPAARRSRHWNVVPPHCSSLCAALLYPSLPFNTEPPRAPWPSCDMKERHHGSNVPRTGIALSAVPVTMALTNVITSTPIALAAGRQATITGDEGCKLSTASTTFSNSLIALPPVGGVPLTGGEVGDHLRVAAQGAPAGVAAAVPPPDQLPGHQAGDQDQAGGGEGGSRGA